MHNLHTHVIRQPEIRITKNDWNIYFGDWLDLAPKLSPRSIDLLYADPPFNTGSRKSAAAGSFDDSWPDPAAWIEWLRARLEATLPALKPSATILLHVDWRTSHHARLLLDDLLGPSNFLNHLVWRYGLGGSSPTRFAHKHDDILFYKTGNEPHFFEPPRVPATSNRMKGQLKKMDSIIEIPSINNMASERVGYPTQKPLALLELLITACCPKGGTVLDPCCGSGTTLLAAARTGRNAIGFDINPEAIEITRERLAAHAEAADSSASSDRSGR